MWKPRLQFRYENEIRTREGYLKGKTGNKKRG
jgi:hypothetical protein